MTELCDERCVRWLDALEARHLRDLRWQEVTRALRALSATYVQRRARIRAGGVLDGAGKRAAFALYYAPLHFLLVRAIVRQLDAGNALVQSLARGRARHGRRDRAATWHAIADLGCGAGVAGAAWSMEAGATPSVLGIDRHPWALAEAAWNYERLGIRGRVRRGDLVGASETSAPAAVVAAFAVNELDHGDRERLLPALTAWADCGTRILIVEPIAKSLAAWWPSWARAFLDRGGRADEWRIPVSLPALLARLDAAAGLNHRELTGRSLFM